MSNHPHLRPKAPPTPKMSLDQRRWQRWAQRQMTGMDGRQAGSHNNWSENRFRGFMLRLLRGGTPS